MAFGLFAPARHKLLIDLKGKSTLGEMYLDALMDRYQDKDAVLERVDPKNIDEDVVRAIKRALTF